MNTLTALGRFLFDSLRAYPLIAGMFYRSLREGWRDRREGVALFRENFLRQILFTGVEALPFVLITALITGAAVVMVLLGKFAFLTPDRKVLGDLLVSVLVRELGPLMTAMIVILRSGTAIAVELGYMRVLKEMDALDAMGISHFRFVILPRFIGVVVAVTCLFLHFDVMAAMGGFALAKLVSPIRMGWSDYIGLFGATLAVGDVLIGVVKALLFGSVISFAAMFHGYGVKLSFIEIPQAASKTAITALFSCLVFNFVVTLMFAWAE